jgi:sec-independent protein translocase protein TatA
MELSSIWLFFNIGAPELFVIVLVVIIFFGSKKIPELMRGLGKGMREFKNVTGEIQHEIRKSANSIEKDLKDTDPGTKETK